MLNDDELERAACKLADFRLNSALPGILDQYAALIERELQAPQERLRRGAGCADGAQKVAQSI